MPTSARGRLSITSSKKALPQARVWDNFSFVPQMVNTHLDGQHTAYWVSWGRPTRGDVIHDLDDSGQSRTSAVQGEQNAVKGRSQGEKERLFGAAAQGGRCSRQKGTACAKV